MSVRKVLLGAVAVGTVLMLWGCHFGVGGRHHRRHGPPPGFRGPADHYQVQYKPFTTTRQVKCPVCGGSGTLDKPYICTPAPVQQNIRP